MVVLVLLIMVVVVKVMAAQRFGRWVFSILVVVVGLMSMRRKLVRNKHHRRGVLLYTYKRARATVRCSVYTAGRGFSAF